MAPVPNRPGMIFPTCPTCGQPVTSTSLEQGVIAVPTDHLARALNPDTDVTMAARADAVPDGWAVVDPHQAPTAHEYDVLTLSCGCELVGERSWLFNVEAINLTWPDLRIELAIVVPAALIGEEVPRSFSTSTTVTPGELLDDPDGVPAAIARHLSNLANLAAAAVTS